MQQLVGLGRLRQEPSGTCGERGAGVREVISAGEGHHPQIRVLRPQRGDEVDAASAREGQVHHRQPGPVLPYGPLALVGVRCGGHDDHASARGRTEEKLQAAGEQRVIVDDHDLERLWHEGRQYAPIVLGRARHAREQSDPSPETFEHVIALVRIGVVAAGAALLLTGVDAVRTYPTLGWATVVVAAAYAAVMIVRPTSLPVPMSTVADGVLTTSLVAATGAGRSPALAILLLVVISTAMRFQLRAALITAVLTAALMATVVATVPNPTLDDAVRAQIAAWWSLMLVFGALLAGILAKLERGERDRLAEVRARAAALSALDHERREFLRVVAHELRTPIASVRALARRAADDTGVLDDDERRSAMTLIESHAEHLAVFGDVLREVAGATDLENVDRPRLADVALDDVVHGAVAAAVAAAGRPANSVEVDCPRTVVCTDAAKLRRILTNLVDNALRHHEHHTSVEVRASVEPGHVLISVADRGPGLSDALIARAFERYASFGQRRGSSGLGLWIVRELTRALGGTVIADARPGGGLVVTVDLPADAASSSLKCGPSLQPPDWL